MASPEEQSSSQEDKGWTPPYNRKGFSPFERLGRLHVEKRVIRRCTHDQAGAVKKGNQAQSKEDGDR